MVVKPIQIDLPAGAFAHEAERQLAAAADFQKEARNLDRADQVMRHGKEVERVMILTDNVFDRLPDRPCVLVRAAPAGQGQPAMDAMLEAIRKQLEKQVAEAAFRLRDLSQPKAFLRCGYPIDLAVHGPEGDQVRSFGRKLAERLRGSRKLTDVWTDAESADRPRVQFDVDARAARALGSTKDRTIRRMSAVEVINELPFESVCLRESAVKSNIAKGLRQRCTRPATLLV